jgi:hypothetical protein
MSSPLDSSASPLAPPSPPPFAPAAAATTTTTNPLLLGVGVGGAAAAAARSAAADAANATSVAAILRLALQKAEEDENAAKRFEAKVGEVPTSIFPIGRYLQYRRKASSVRALCGRNARHVTPDEIDAIVNTLTLVNTLLLTIPFGMLGGLSGSQYWDGAYKAFTDRAATCFVMNGAHV